ncbi:hypothetical protein H5P32_25420 [Mycobacterium paraseoulense]|nr:hypothetical protein [Mycobacterium paraseoulense]
MLTMTLEPSAKSFARVWNGPGRTIVRCGRIDRCHPDLVQAISAGDADLAEHLMRELPRGATSLQGDRPSGHGRAANSPDVMQTATSVDEFGDQDPDRVDKLIATVAAVVTEPAAAKPQTFCNSQERDSRTGRIRGRPPTEAIKLHAQPPLHSQLESSALLTQLDIGHADLTPEPDERAELVEIINKLFAQVDQIGGVPFRGNVFQCVQKAVAALC